MLLYAGLVVLCIWAAVQVLGALLDFAVDGIQLLLYLGVGVFVLAILLSLLRGARR